MSKCLVTGGAGFTRPPRPRAKMYYTYALESLKDNKLYIGWTDDLRERLIKHNKGKVQATKWRRPLELIYYEACLSKQAAHKTRKIF